MNPKKKYIFILLLCIGLIGTIYIRYSLNKVKQSLESNTARTSKNYKSLRIGQNSLQVEIADSVPKITLGLGERDTLGSDGMLFVMPTRTVPAFWMKGMRFALDFVWIDGNRVIDLTENVPAEPTVSDANLKIHSPKSPATHVLELNAGEIKRRGISIEDTVSY